MNVEITSEKWTAGVFVSDDDGASGEYVHVQAHIRGEDRDASLAGAKWVLNVFALNREAFIRVEPEATEDFDFDTRTKRYGAFVRFSFALRQGEWRKMEMTTSISLAALGTSQNVRN